MAKKKLAGNNFVCVEGAASTMGFSIPKTGPRAGRLLRGQKIWVGHDINTMLMDWAKENKTSLSEAYEFAAAKLLKLI